MSKDGGPAFPMPNAEWSGPSAPGMTLRDYFAAKALNGIVTAMVTPDGATAFRQVAHEFQMSEADCAAATAYQYADAMLKAREL